MSRRRPRGFLLSLAVLVGVPAWTAAVPAWGQPLQVAPPSVRLEGNFAQAQLVVSQQPAAVADQGALTATDLTHQVAYASSDEHVVTVDKNGRLLARGDGKATITVQSAVQDTAAKEAPVCVEVEVADVLAEPKIDFSYHVLPVMNKAGCNAAACHASQHGKGGFKLSVFGFAPDEDYAAIVRDQFGRRASLVEPTQSLVLLKPTALIPHGGGRRLQPGSTDYEIFRCWLAGGAPAPKPTDAKVTALHVAPSRRLTGQDAEQQLRVEATYSDGRQRDVTAWARFDTMDDAVVKVTPDGFCRTVGRGQAAVMVRFEGQAEICEFVVPYSDKADLAGWSNNNFVDEFAAKKFAELGITPSPLCDDATFLRRAYLDVTGTTPTVEQVRAFLDSKAADKRTRLVDELLGLTGDPTRDIHNNDYAAYWAIKWSDLIRSSSNTLNGQGMWATYNWINESLRENKPMDRFAQELVSARGSLFNNGPANYFRAANNPQDLAETTSQLFMGVRLTCAKCHHHPFEKYSQDDYYGFAAFFARVGTKPSWEFGMAGGDTAVIVKSSGEVTHPRTGKVMPPKPLDGQPVDDPLDRRIPLARWLTSSENPYFARNLVNRYFAYLMGRGLVEPVDDLRATNPPTNPGLMTALCDELVKSGYNVKHLLRTIMVSRLYQLDSQPTKENASDEKFYSHFHVKRLAAEPLLDAISYATAVPTKFKGMPVGTKAIELPDAIYPDYFLTTFGKPKRASVCECERMADENLSQALHTINGDTLAAKLSDSKGRIAKLLADKRPHEEIVEELYLSTLARRPTADERELCGKLLAESPTPREFYEDLLWLLINSKEFLFVN